MDYRLNKNYTKQEEQIHVDLLEIIEQEGIHSVQQALKRLGQPSNLEALKRVLEHLYQFSTITALAVISQAKKVWRKKGKVNVHIYK